jgi:hypothetical protein
MVLTDHNDQRIAVDPASGECAIVDLSLDETDIGRAVPHVGSDTLGVGNSNADINA